MEKAVLRTKNLSVNYGSSQILKNINISFEKNKITAIIGPSGCGKSTFLKTLNRTVEEYGGKVQGEVFLNDMNIGGLSAEKLRKSIGMVFQNPVVFPFSVYKNMVYAPLYYGVKKKKELDELVEAFLKKAGLFDEVKDSLNMHASNLSGGQQQRLAIARCLTAEPEVLLLDEPCSALDIKNTFHIEKMLIELKKEYSIIIVTHNLAQARRIADYAVFMDEGQVVEHSSAGEIFDNPVDSRTREYITYMKN